MSRNVDWLDSESLRSCDCPRPYGVTVDRNGDPYPGGRCLCVPHDCGYTLPGWYFWDETGAYVRGPYATEYAAQQAELQYAEWLG